MSRGNDPRSSAAWPTAPVQLADLTAFEVARAGQVEKGIQKLGYELIPTEAPTASWFNRSTRAAARIASVE